MKQLLSVLLACTLLCGAALAETASPESCDITLVENATTGYLWSYAVSDETVLSVIDGEQAAGDESLAGAPGTHSFSVVGVGAGEASVTFTYSQPWDGGGTGESFIFTFTVDEALHVAILDTQSNPGESDPDLIILTQYEDPATGLVWSYELSDDSVLQLAWDEYIAAENADGTQSATGMHHWAFQAVGEGNADVNLICLDEDDEEQAVVTYGFAVQGPFLSDALQTVTWQGFGKLIMSNDDIIILSQDELPLLEEDERILLSDDGIVVLDGDQTNSFSKDDLPLLSEDDMVQIPMIGDALQTVTRHHDEWVPGDDDIIILSQDDLSLLEEDERILLSDDGIVVLDGDQTNSLSKDDLPLLSEDDIIRYPVLGDALQSAAWQGFGKLIMSNDDIIILSQDELPLLEEDERILLSDDGIIVLDGDQTNSLSKDDLPLLSEDDIVQYPWLSDALQTATWQDDGKIMGDQEILLLSQDDLPLLEEDERILLSDDGIVVLDGDETVTLSKDEWPLLSEDDIVQFPMIGDALQGFGTVTDGWVPDEDEFFLLSRDEVPFLEEDEYLALSEDGIVCIGGDETVAFAKDEWPLLSEDDIVQFPMIGDALQTAAWHDDGKIMSDQEILLLSQDDLPLLEEDERILLSDDGIVVLDGDQTNSFSKDELPLLSEDDIIRYPVLGDALQSATWQDDGKIMGVQDSDGEVAIGDGEIALQDKEAALQNDDLLIVPVSVEGNMSFVPEMQ